MQITPYYNHPYSPCSQDYLRISYSCPSFGPANPAGSNENKNPSQPQYACPQVTNGVYVVSGMSPCSGQASRSSNDFSPYVSQNHLFTITNDNLPGSGLPPISFSIYKDISNAPDQCGARLSSGQVTYLQQGEQYYIATPSNARSDFYICISPTTSTGAGG